MYGLPNSFISAQRNFDNATPPDFDDSTIGNDVEYEFKGAHDQVLEIVRKRITGLYCTNSISASAKLELIDSRGNISDEIDSLTDQYLTAIKDLITETAKNNSAEFIDYE